MSRNDLPNEKAPNFNARLRETLMTYLGRTGDPLDRGITLRDLVENGIVEPVSPNAAKSNGTLPLTPGPVIPPSTDPDLSPPPTPTGFKVDASITSVFIEHDVPIYTQGHGHLRTHVYGIARSAGEQPPVFADASPVMQFTGSIGSFSTNPSTTWHLWIKWESVDGVLSASPAGGTNGLVVTTGQDVALLLDALTGQITESQLYADLGARIDLIDVGDDALVTRMGSAETNITTVQEVTDTLATDITSLTSTVDGYSTSISTLTTTTNGLSAKYTVKIDSNGYVSGFGLASDANNATPTSTFGIRADSFYVASPSGPGITPTMPFIVRTTSTTINGVAVPAGIYITDTYIQNGTIVTAKIGELAVSTAKIADAAITNAKIGSLAVGTANIADAAITNAKIGSLAVGTANIASLAVTNAKISSLDAAKITTGFLDAARIDVGTLTADKLAASSASIATGYSFLLGSGQTLNGYPAAVGGSNSNATGMGIAGYITSTSSGGWGATTGATVSTTGLGVAGYNATSTSFTSFRTFGAFGHGDWGGSMIYHRSPGTANNGSLPPRTIGYGGTSTDGLYGAYYGTTASVTERISEFFGGNGAAVVGGVARRYNTTGVGLLTEVYLATGTYSVQATQGAISTPTGVLPFTGMHDGLISSDTIVSPGDIVIDDVVLKRIDVSNSIVTVTPSTTANQKGVIGVFVTRFETPPADWLPAVQLVSPRDEVWGPTVDDPAINPYEYEIPYGFQVVHVNALGEGLINVCGENGDIEKGDLIVTSSLPGKGMKQSDDIIRSYTVAKARESVRFSSPTEVKQVACIYVSG